MQFLAVDIAEQDVVKVGLAILCGGLLGLERQYKNKTAGFRTIILICLGSAIFTMIAQHAGAVANLNIVTGIGLYSGKRVNYSRSYLDLGRDWDGCWRRELWPFPIFNHSYTACSDSV
jgi:hypothetical protein